MNNLLIHTSDIKVDILEPKKLPSYDRPCICFSLNQFISFFGQYVYLFDKNVLEKNFHIDCLPSKGVESSFVIKPLNKTYRYLSQDLGYEFRIYKPIDVKHYGIGIITNFNHLKGVLEMRLEDVVISRERFNLDFGGT